jgi:hypothetical protein
MKDSGVVLISAAAQPKEGRLQLLDRSDAIALSHLLGLASALIDWNELAASVEEFMSETEGLRWYAPTATTALLRSYYLRRWFALNYHEFAFLLGGRVAAPSLDLEQVKRFDHFFEHYQLKDIVQPHIERQLGLPQASPLRAAISARSRRSHSRRWRLAFETALLCQLGVQVQIKRARRAADSDQCSIRIG